MKYLVVLTFGVVAAFCIAISQGVSSSYGTKGMHDVLLHRKYCIIERPWWPWKKATCDVEYPPKGFLNFNTISLVEAIDQTGGKNTSTGYASLSQGGPGSKLLKVHIKSDSSPLNFTVNIYGHP